MAMKCYTKLETAKERCPIVFQGHPSNFKVTQDKTSPILTQIGLFRTIGWSQLSNPSDLPCCEWKAWYFIKFSLTFVLRVQLAIKMMHIGLDNGLVPNRRQAIILNHCWPDPLTYICGIRGRWVNTSLSFQLQLSLKEINDKMLLANCQQFCLSLHVLSVWNHQCDEMMLIPVATINSSKTASWKALNVWL